MADARNIIAYEQYARNTAVSVSGTDVELTPTRLGRTLRTAIILTPVTAGVIVNISLGDNPAVIDQGIRLIQGQPFTQSANNAEEAKQTVWQGAIHAIASGAGSVAITEQFTTYDN